jgi:predicted MFS family arabinose efflux permease
MRAAPSERTIIFLVGAIQFVNILDFMMVMPLGPDFATALKFDASKVGLIGGSYTFAAALSGIACSFFLDRFDRRRALGVAMLGLVLGTAAGAFATDLNSLMIARVVAGSFGGPATSLALSIVADVIPPARRGRAMGAVMGAFSAASVLGVPAGLELARLGGWRMPFLAVAGLGLLVAAAAITLMPPMRGHLDGPRQEKASTAELLQNPTALLSLAATAVALLGSFILIPNLSAYMQENLHYPREHLGILYMVGGALSFVVMMLIGRLVDRLGATLIATAGTLIFLADLYFGFVTPVVKLPVLAIFVGFMLAMAVRNVPFQALSSRVPRPHERARFMSMQSAVQHLAGAAGAFLSSQILHVRPDRTLAGMDRAALIAIILGAALPVLLYLIEARVRRREQAA